MTPIRINLLPHRQLRKARQQRWFVILAAIVFGLGLATVGAGQAYIASLKSDQDARNVFLKTELAKLDKQIEEIAHLKEKTKDLLDRKEVVESLQNNRSEAVHMFDELMRLLPDGLYLKSVKQTGDAVSLAGYAQSSARVSTFMRALEAATLFDEPVLIEVKSAMVGPVRSYEFSLNVKIARIAPDSDKDKKSKHKTGDKS
ncbi:MAG: fimbrial protein [Hydrogenophilales bacterium 28-61-23]|nr:MAG: fimbrial protein [Hydrogenophilales bacterium 28-61-23]